MTFTFTTSGVAYALLALGALACSLWFFRSFQKSGGFELGRPIGLYLSVFALVLGFEHTLFAVAAFFFVENSEAFYAILVANTFLLAPAAALGVYLFLYIFFPHRPVLPWVLTVLLYGFFTTAYILASHPQPSLVSTSVSQTISPIDKDLSFVAGLLYYFLWQLYIVPALIIFFKNFVIVISKVVKEALAAVRCFAKLIYDGNYGEISRNKNRVLLMM